MLKAWSAGPAPPSSGPLGLKPTGLYAGRVPRASKVKIWQKPHPVRWYFATCPKTRSTYSTRPFGGRKRTCHWSIGLCTMVSCRRAGRGDFGRVIRTSPEVLTALPLYEAYSERDKRPREIIGAERAGCRRKCHDQCSEHYRRLTQRAAGNPFRRAPGRIQLIARLCGSRRRGEPEGRRAAPLGEHNPELRHRLVVDLGRQSRRMDLRQ